MREPGEQSTYINPQSLICTPPLPHHTHKKKILWVRGIYYGHFLSLAIKIDGESKLTSYCACMDIVVFNA